LSGRNGQNLSAIRGPVIRDHVVAIAASALLASSCEQVAPAHVAVPADSAAGESPFRLAGPNGAALIVAVHINGQGPFDFVLDTGATLTCVDRDLATRLNLEDARRVARGSSIGGTGQVRLVRIDSLRIGRSSAHDLVGCALQLDQLQRMPGLQAHGLVGLNFLKSFRVTLDFERRVLRLDQR
jgi:predicted aspartyl protease